MPSASNLAAALMAGKPAGVSYVHYTLPIANSVGLASAIKADLSDAVYSAALSFAEGLSGLLNHRVSWAVVKLYYSAFYAMRASLLLDDIIPFVSGEFYLCDGQSGTIKKGGRSSHIWQWSSIRSYRRLSAWCYSIDSAQAYDALRDMRELVNYRVGFPDPASIGFLSQALGAGVAKSFRTYRDDAAFFYTYLPDHLVLAYPTRLVLDVSSRFAASGGTLGAEHTGHLKSIWPFKDKAPLAA